MKIEINKEDFEFLKDLQHELNTQDNDGNADPVFWGVMESEEVAVPEGCGTPYITYDDGKWSLEEAVEQADEWVKEEDNEELTAKWEELDKRDFECILDFIQESLGVDSVYDIIDFRTQDKLCRNTGAFLTKRACKEYIEKYKYNHCNPRTYAMTAFRNFELERLLKILKTIELKEEYLANEDLEEAGKHYLYGNILYDDVYVGNPTDKDCIEMFKAGARWQKEQLIDKACDWLKNNWRNYAFLDGDNLIHFGHWENDFRKAMED